MSLFLLVRTDGEKCRLFIMVEFMRIPLLGPNLHGWVWSERGSSSIGCCFAHLLLNFGCIIVEL